MSGFSKESFVGKLSKLSESQQSIQTLSHWVQYHKKAVNESAAVWAAEVLRVSPSRQLLFVYLVNDIMQNSKRKGPEFVEAYGDKLLQTMPRIFAAASPSVQAKLLRIINIWDERRILEVPLLNDLRAAFSGDSPAVAAPADGGSRPPPAAPRPAAMDVADADDDEYVPEPIPPVASATGGGGGMALADLLVTLDQVGPTLMLEAAPPRA